MLISSISSKLTSAFSNIHHNITHKTRTSKLQLTSSTAIHWIMNTIPMEVIVSQLHCILAWQCMYIYILRVISLEFGGHGFTDVSAGYHTAIFFIEIISFVNNCVSPLPHNHINSRPFPDLSQCMTNCFAHNSQNRWPTQPPYLLLYLISRPPGIHN